MPTVSKAVRVTTPAAAVWRDCNGCGDSAPLLPDETHCWDCRHPQQLTLFDRINGRPAAEGSAA